jgi:hypothetical protein
MTKSLDKRNIKPGKYQHFKGALYQVIDTVYHSETQELMVLYKPLYGEQTEQQQLWVRPYDMFVETVERDGQSLARFEWVSEN